MKYTLILRKLIIDGSVYYQVMDKGIGDNIDFELGSIEITESNKYLNCKLKPLENINNKEIGYLEIDRDFYDSLDLSSYVFFKGINGNISVIQDLKEENDVVYEFFNTFHDFKLIPDYNIEEVINNTRLKLNKRVLGQDEAINKILSKIYNNFMFNESDLDILDIKENKSNILLMGPYGSGKSTIKEVIKESITEVPVIEYKLTGDYKKDISEIIKKLLFVSGGNKYLAERGIVIFDGINSMSSNFIETDSDTINIYIDTLNQIINSSMINIILNENSILKFNYAMITNICIVDINYDYKHAIKKENDIYYSRINASTISELGFTPDILIDCFDNEIIFMNEMNYKKAISILKDKDISPLYKIKKVLESKGKIVKISNDFVDYLVKYALKYNEGFLVINKILKYVLESKNMNNKIIIFKKEDIDNLEIGLVYDDEVTYEEEEDNIVLEQDDGLKVDLTLKSINNLKRQDVVNLIKNNIKGQDSQIFDIVNSFYEYVFNKYKNFSKSEYRKIKDNILIIGSTGVGKTAIIENLVSIFNIPFKREDATRYSGTGIVGDDVSCMIKDLVEVCNGDFKKAEHGIIFIDEIDKIASSFSSVDIGKDVQNALLTLIEGNKITIRPDQKEYFNPYTFDTSNLLFIGAGAFEGIDLIRKERIKKEKSTTLGFNSSTNNKYVNEDITISDLTKYGMSTQLMARLSNVIRLNSLNENILLDIIENSNDGYVNLKKKSYEFEGIKITMTDGFKKSLARVSYEDGKGARSIKTTFKKLLNEIDKNIMNDSYEEVVLTDNSLNDFKSIQYIKKK